MDDRAPRTVDRLVGALDQLGPGLRQHGDRDVVRNQVLVDERAHEVEVRLRGGREADLDLLDPEPDQEVEEPPLATGIHRADERLVPVTQVGRAPDRRLREHHVRPGAVGQRDGFVGAVLVERHRSGHRTSAQLLRKGGLLPLGAGARVRVCRRSHPLAGKEEGKREQAGAAGEKIVARAAEHWSHHRPQRTPRRAGGGVPRRSTGNAVAGHAAPGDSVARRAHDAAVSCERVRRRTTSA